MSRFYANIQGSRGDATRQGSEKSGIYAHIRGWDIGVGVIGYVNDDGNDEFEIRITGGSNGNNPTKRLAIVKRDMPDDDGYRVLQSPNLTGSCTILDV